MSNFSALQTALSGLIAHQRALQTAGHNASNAATKGYSRQRVDLVSAGAGVVPAVWSKTDGIGNGVRAAGVVRIRDEFLEARALREAGSLSLLRTQATSLGRVEMIFPEPSDVGLAHQLSELWGAFDDLANQPGASAPRVALLERARTVADELNRGAAELTNLHRSALEQAEALTSEVNATAARVAELNGAVRNATAAGLDAHDLADQRDLLIERLGELVGVTTRQGELGTTDVFLGGSSLVRGDRYEQLQVVETTDPTAHPDFTEVEVQWAKDGYRANVADGEVGGLLDTTNRMIPHYLSELDAVAATLASTVNAVHEGGFDLDGAAGLAFFTGTTASDLAVNAVVAADPRRVAAAGSDGGAPPASAGPLDAGNATLLARLGEGQNSADAVYKRMIGGLGVETQATNRREQIQTEVVVQVDAARDSVKGVNLDEEMTSLVQSQHAYAASARLMTAVDEMLDTLISRTGLVGR
ncbi:flagellar hook-associated protein FlgK [Actinomarinicola tropica]|uniref:Flagellar hook-associated protein 1 n=1 Tax=Actinomarinicola tropica TaxID=2789776 RepID=A0A5Q2RG64_9ACTN|nr:flagellar hook-associated protein FlgK [Actinomarinicola tropica]QGG94634.1 flagellar hook-associated protein FlgK [Actinomarinicola tropica]